jgi:hypothetical protein
MRKSTGTKRTGSAAASSKSRNSSTESKPKVSDDRAIPLARPLSGARKPRGASKTLPDSRGPVSIELAICLDDSNDADLIRGKTYRIIKDTRAAAEGYLRVVDESGEDYLYADDRFLVVKKRVPSSIAEKLFS